MTDSSGLSRRGFLQAGMLAGAGALAAGALAGCAPRPQETPHPETASQEAHTYWLGEEPAVAVADIVATRDTDFLIIGAGNGEKKFEEVKKYIEKECAAHGIKIDMDTVRIAIENAWKDLGLDHSTEQEKVV